MRTTILAAVLGLALPACLIGTGSITSGGDDNPPPTCGNGTIDPNETCDDGNTASGDGCSASCQMEAVPHVAVTVDHPTVTSDLGAESTITVTVTAQMGFAGDVTLAVAATDTTSAPITDWATTLDTTTVTLAQDGTQTATLKLSAQGDAAMLAGTVTVTASSTAPAVNATVGVTFNPVFDVMFTDDGTGTAVYPLGHGVNNPYLVKVNRTLAVYNASPTKILVVHSDGIAGFPHEGSSPGTASNQAYMGSGPLTSVGDETPFYCHNDAGTTTELLDPGSATRPYVKVVQ